VGGAWAGVCPAGRHGLCSGPAHSPRLPLQRPFSTPLHQPSPSTRAPIPPRVHGNAEPLQNFPWTALGYTYDWGSKNHVGPSEFLSLKGTQVFFHRRATNDAYCTPE
jgi:hypothetical protein